jgi:hypothetical protein
LRRTTGTQSRRRRLLSGTPITEQIMRFTKEVEREQVLVFEEY